MLFDFVGYLALGLNLYSMYSKGECKLRAFSAIANLTYVIYGVLISALPLVIGCSIAVILHVHRLYKLKQGKDIELINE